MEKFDLMPILKLAVKNAFILLITGIVFAGAVFGYCEYIATPKYSATGSVLVTNGAIMTVEQNGTSSILNNGDIVASMNLVNTVKDILVTNGIYKEMEEVVDGKYKYDELFSFAEVKRKNESSLFIDVTFTVSDEKEALQLTNKFLQLAPNYINEYVPNSEVAISSADKSEKVFPSTASFMIIAAVAGMAVAFLILLLINSTNTVVRGKEDFIERFDIPVLGNIPDFEKSKSDKYNSYNYNYSYGYQRKRGGY